ncbi:hypothetical protein QR680_009300 [Steinernema hermaphroditum]|uniref:Uncharacterized protein n=1 Tax=Steinernema hermaphroditum TaxID=289476 RepID=A0AA39M9N0_9BILA|nr:hypothetical protein QR680_009300 [Steinernema hermaphroditum]
MWRSCFSWSRSPCAPPRGARPGDVGSPRRDALRPLRLRKERSALPKTRPPAASYEGPTAERREALARDAPRTTPEDLRGQHARNLLKLPFQGDSGSPVVYVHGGVRYLLGVSMSVQSSESSDRPQLCGMRARGDRRRFAVGEIRRRARGNRPDLPIPEEPICNCCSKLFSKYDGFGQSDSAELRKYNDNHVMHRVLFNYLKFLVTREDLDIGFKSQDVATRAMNAYTTYLLYKKRRRRLS